MSVKVDPVSGFVLTDPDGRVLCCPANNDCICPDNGMTCTLTATITLCDGGQTCTLDGSLGWIGNTCWYSGGGNCNDCNTMPVSMDLYYFTGEGGGWFLTIFFQSDGEICDCAWNIDLSPLTENCCPSGEYTIEIPDWYGCGPATMVLTMGCTCCACRPTHASIEWSLYNPDEPAIDSTFTLELDIPSGEDNCAGFTHTQTETITGVPCLGGDPVSGNVQLVIEVSYDTIAAKWEIYIYEFITMGAFFCEAVYSWPDTVSLFATMDPARPQFGCPLPFSIDEDLTDDAHVSFLGHVTATFT